MEFASLHIWSNLKHTLNTCIGGSSVYTFFRINLSRRFQISVTVALKHVLNCTGDIAPKKFSAMDPCQLWVNLKSLFYKKRAPWYYRFFLWLCCHMSDYQEVGFVEKDAPCSVRVMWTEVVRIILRIWSKYVGNHWWDCIRLLKFNEKVWLQPSWNDPYDPPAHDKRMSAIGVLTICEIEDSYIKEGSW